MKTRIPAQSNLVPGYAGSARFFDIVNGFFNRCRDASGSDLLKGLETRALQNLAEIIVRTYYSAAVMQGCR